MWCSCQQHWSQYVCPRCNLRYCSLDCYKKHGSRCTESFYRSASGVITCNTRQSRHGLLASCRDNTTEQLQSLQASQAERQQMLQMLHRLQQSDNDGGAEADDTASCSTHDSDTEQLSDHIQQKLSMAVCMRAASPAITYPLV